jgi:hypothetical protein
MSPNTCSPCPRSKHAVAEREHEQDVSTRSHLNGKGSLARFEQNRFHSSCR